MVVDGLGGQRKWEKGAGWTLCRRSASITRLAYSIIALFWWICIIPGRIVFVIIFVGRGWVFIIRKFTVIRLRGFICFLIMKGSDEF